MNTNVFDNLCELLQVQGGLREDGQVRMDKGMWADEETKVFIGFMEEHVVDGWKADCGQFRPETSKKLALKMLEAFLTCTLIAKHCKNKHE
ncbi:hypothetical protein AHAS_Ahas11G0255500 [Arachis hypogaea]